MGCQVEVEKLSKHPLIDLSKSTVEVKVNHVAADNAATGVIYVWLRNHKNEGVEGVVPEFSSSDTGVNSGSCTSSNSSGLSICQIKSSVVGLKDIKISKLGKDDGELSSTLRFVDLSLQRPKFYIGGGGTALVDGNNNSGGALTMKAKLTLAESTHHQVSSGPNVEGGVVLTDVYGSTTMTNPTAPFQVIYKPKAKIGMQGTLAP